MKHIVAQPALFDTSTPQGGPVKRYSIPVYRVSLVQDGTLGPYPKTEVRTSYHVARILWDYLERVDREHFVALCVDQKNKVIGVNTVSIGSLTASLVHPREFFKPALLCNAAAVVAGHNHPTGNPAPSDDDRKTTERLCNAGKLLGITLVDHVILGECPDYFSFADAGLIPDK